MADSFSRIGFLRTAARLAFDALRDGRLSWSPRRWLLDLRHLRSSMAGRDGPITPARLPTEAESAKFRTALLQTRRAALAAFLQSGDQLIFSSHDRVKVSILLALHNRAELTLQCLRSIRQHVFAPIEVIVVDNHSTDDTAVLLERVHGMQIIRSTENLGFLRACNLAAGAARGEYLLFLNNDTELRPGSVSAALETIERQTLVGVVGGRLVFPDGRLQEAGSIIWNDGSCLGYGRGRHPLEPEYSFARDVDYCSAAFMLTARELFLELGGFDDRYQPAYYEDVDYCVRVWKSGRRVVYDPRAVVTHVEFASATSASSAVSMQLERRNLFVDVHREWLTGQVPPSPGGLLRARDRHRTGQRILVIDDRVPHVSVGFGFPRAVELLRAMVDLGYAVTLLPLSVVDESWDSVYQDVPLNVEVLLGYGARRVGELFRLREGFYDWIVVSRSHNMALLRSKMGEPDTWMRQTRVLYDAEAITASREIGRRRLLGDTLPDAKADALVAEEIALARGVDAVLAVSEDEGEQFEQVAPGRVHVVSHALDVTETGRSFEHRRGVLFVGSFHEHSPNADAVVWFARQVLPLLSARVGESVRLTIVGQDPPDEVLGLAGDCVSVLGSIPDLWPLYDEARVFVAPTRFAAGIPLKVIHAAAHGLPVVATRRLARQLGWQDTQELLVADEPGAFADACAALWNDSALWHRVRALALTRVRTDHSTQRFRAAISSVLQANHSSQPPWQGR